MNQSPQKNIAFRFGLAVVLVFFILAGFISGYYVGTWNVDQQDASVSLEEILTSAESLIGDNSVDEALIKDVWQSISDRYVDGPVDQSELFYGALRGIVAAINDPYSRFLDPEETSVFNQELNGNFEGIGTEIGIKNNQLTIIAPLPNSPAEQAGLKARDVVLQIDGEDASQMSIEAAVTNIRGEKGSTVVLTVLSVGDEEAHDVSIVRDVIEVESVIWQQLENDIALIEIIHFDSDTDKDFNTIANEVLLADPQGLIIDVRNNPGGFLDAVIEIAGTFFTGSELIVSEQSGSGVRDYTASSSPKFTEVPVVVLVNGGSASASEILAGALQDHQRATIVGEQTFGKGTVQDYEQFSDGSSLKLTVSKWLTPDGHSIDEQGITPDVTIELTEEDYNNDRDPQLEKAVELLLE